MEDLKQKLIDRAIEKHNRIFPCGSRKNFSECFTILEEQLLFWYNTEDHDTKVLYEPLTLSHQSSKSY
jgi:hypothetical protein